MFLSREEKERQVIDLYSQGKTYRQIAEEVRISPNDIHTILKKKEEEENNNSIVTNNQQQSSSSSIITKAYELLSQRKTPLQVAIELNIRQSQATKYYREYWKLKRLDKLDSIYKELGDEGTRDFLKLYKLAKNERMGAEQVVKLLKLADEDKDIGLSSFEKRRKWRIVEIHELDIQIEKSKNYLHSLNNEIAGAKYSLDYWNGALLTYKKRAAETL